MTTVLVTGSAGFIGKNLLETLRRQNDITLRAFDVSESREREEIYRYLQEADVIYHLAGTNRPEKVEDYETVNVGLTCEIVEYLESSGLRPTIIFSSSIQATLDNPYGVSKKKAEEVLSVYAKKTGASVHIFRFPNVFGKWCKPNYNSVVATFCYNISHGIDISISDKNKELELVYIDDVVSAFLGILENDDEKPGCWMESVNPTYTTILGTLAEKIYQFRDIRHHLLVPDLSDKFTKCLYATYHSYVDGNDFSYSLKAKPDIRGTLAELLKSAHFGQIFISRTQPGVTRGNHYHNTKTEKFCVIEGEAIIRFRHVLGKEIISYQVSGSEFKVVDIPPGYIHSIENVGKGILIVLFWSSEIFDPQSPDTYHCEVLNEKI